jgi:glycine betaine/proline transport system substrate-binding protein
MSKRLVGGLLVLCAAVGLAIAGGAAGGGAAADCGEVVLDENAWAGSTANVYVLKHVLEKNLGCEVEVEQITEGGPVFQAMADGKVDVLLEDWQHTSEYAQYVRKQKSVVFAGPLGITGLIGWFIPKYLLQQYPQFKTWRGLKGKEEIFKSPESGSQGMFLGGDPSYVQKDRALIKELKLDFKHVSVGAEPTQVARWTQLYKQRKPVIFYWYDPQYLNGKYQVAQVQLPKRFKGCKDDEKQAGNHACAYPSYPLMKLMSADFAKSGSPAVAVVKRFRWTAADQNAVAKLIGLDRVKPEKAAEVWVKANPAKVKLWLGK